MMELVDMHGMSPLGSISKLGTRYLKSSEGVIGVLLCFKIRGTHIFFWWRFCMRGDPSGKKGTTSLYLHVLAADFHIMPYCFPMLSICPKPGHPVQRSSIIHELDYMPDIVSIWDRQIAPSCHHSQLYQLRGMVRLTPRHSWPLYLCARVLH